MAGDGFPGGHGTLCHPESKENPICFTQKLSVLSRSPQALKSGGERAGRGEKVHKEREENDGEGWRWEKQSWLWCLTDISSALGFVGPPDSSSDKEPACYAGGPGGTSPRGCKESDTTERLTRVTDAHSFTM